MDKKSAGIRCLCCCGRKLALVLKPLTSILALLFVGLIFYFTSVTFNYMNRIVENESIPKSPDRRVGLDSVKTTLENNPTIQSYDSSIQDDLKKLKFFMSESQMTNKSWAPFIDVSVRNPKMIILHSYQRCGSSILSQIFNTNPEIFFYFEPLDSLYSSLYGTQLAWNVPSDITSNNDGSRRILPDFEIKEVSVFLKNLLICDVDSLPVETLYHPYQNLFPGQFLSLAEYLTCTEKINQTILACQSKEMLDFCGRRFNQMSEDRMRLCSEILRSEESEIDAELLETFSNYTRCTNNLYQRGSHCVLKYLSACTKTSVRATKTVRGTMRSIGELFGSLPNLRVVHLIRDPRGVVTSRLRWKGTVLGIHATSAEKNESEIMIREASVYCRAVVDDLMQSSKLEEIYPGRIYTVIYDELVMNSSKYINEIYKFLDLKLTDQKIHEIYQKQYRLFQNREAQSTSSLNTAKNIAFQWQKSITFDVRLEIFKVCRDFYTSIPIDWKL